VRDATFRWAPGNKAVWDIDNRYKMNAGFVGLVKQICRCQKRPKVEIESIEAERDRAPCIRRLNFKVMEGQLCFFVGPVGSGKSSVLHALLGELERIQGEVVVHGSVAYAAQVCRC
jgi:ABC-type multidrug transport system fused ATPase/permease subunit